MIDFEQLQRVFKYTSPDSVAYGAWLLSQPDGADDSAQAWQRIHMLFDYSKHTADPGDPERKGRPPLGTAWRPWLLPTWAATKDVALWAVTDTVDQVLAAHGLATRALDLGYYQVVQFDDDWMLVLLDFHEWAGPFPFKFPESSEAFESLTKGYIPMEDSESETIYVKPDTDDVNVGVAALVTGYGPHHALIGVGQSFESVYEAMTELKASDPAFAEERAELERDVRQDNPGDSDEDVWQRVDELLHEDINGGDYTLAPWEAAAYAIIVTHHDHTETPVPETYEEAERHPRRRTLLVTADYVRAQWQIVPGIGVKPHGEPRFVSMRPYDLAWKEDREHVPNWLRAQLVQAMPSDKLEMIVRTPRLQVVVEGVAEAPIYTSWEAADDRMDQVEAERGNVPRAIIEVD